MSKRLGLKGLFLGVLLILAGVMAQKPELSGEVALSPSELVQFEITWQTVLPSLGRVEYGPDTSYGSVTREVPALEGEHTHLLSGLLPGETYHYRIVTRDWQGNETVTEDQTFVAAPNPEAQLAQVGAVAPGAPSAANVLVDDTFDNGLNEGVWAVYNNTESGELVIEDAQLVMRNVGNGSDYGQVGLALQTPLDLTAAPTTITVSYSETGNTEQNPGFWNTADLSGDDNWNHPGLRATVTPDGVSPTSTPPAEGVWTPAEGVEGLTAPYTLTWTITPPGGEGEFGSTMQLDGEEVYSGTFTPGSFDPTEAYFYLYVSTPNEEGTTAIDAVTVEQAGVGETVAAFDPAFDPSGETVYPLAQRSITLGGGVSELDGAASIDLAEGTVMLEPYGGPDDLGGEVWLSWDEDNLYLAARVRDDVHDQTFAGGDMWQGDSLQLALAAAPSEAEGWYEYGFALTEDGPQVWRWLAPEGVETGLVEAAGLEVSRDDDAQETVYKAALPWAELTPLNAETGVTRAFSFIANDSDGDGRKGWLELGSGVGGDKDPSLFLPFELVQVAAGAPQAATTALPEGLLAAWLFDEGDGETVADAVGAHDGSFTAPQWAEGRFGSAAQIAPGENYVSLPGEGLSPEGALTLSAWVYLNAYGEGEFPNRRVVQLGSYDEGSQYGIEDNSYRLLFEFGEFIFDAGPGPEPRQISVPQDEFIALETWHHVAGVYSGDALTLYIDGQEVAREDVNGAALSAPAESRLFIGTKSDLAPEGDWWDGRIDEVAIFDRALSPEELQGVMQGLAVAGVAGAAPAAQQPAGASQPAIVRTDAPITVDGDLAEWGALGGVVQVDSSMVADATDVTDDSDLSLTAQFAYDDDWVYFSADVIDDTLIFERTGDAIWQNDSVEFWFGGQQIAAALVDEAPYLHAYGSLDTSEAEVAVVAGEGGYTVEVALPRTALEEALETSFEAGSSLPVAVGANDADEEGGERTGQIYFPEGWTWGEPDSFELLEFTP